MKPYQAALLFLSPPLRKIFGCCFSLKAMPKLDRLKKKGEEAIDNEMNLEKILR